MVWRTTLNSSLWMRPLRKSLTNWQFSALSWESLVPSANSSDRSVGLGGTGGGQTWTLVPLGCCLKSFLQCAIISPYLRTSSSSSTTILAPPFATPLDLGSDVTSVSILLAVFTLRRQERDKDPFTKCFMMMIWYGTTWPVQRDSRIFMQRWCVSVQQWKRKAGN